MSGEGENTVDYKEQTAEELLDELAHTLPVPTYQVLKTEYRKRVELELLRELSEWAFNVFPRPEDSSYRREQLGYFVDKRVEQLESGEEDKA